MTDSANQEIIGILRKHKMVSVSFLAKRFCVIEQPGNATKLAKALNDLREQGIIRVIPQSLAQGINQVSLNPAHSIFQAA